jgi:hypothetical protein
MVSAALGALAARTAAALAAIAFISAALAQGVAVQAAVDRATVRVNESFTYTIRAEGSLRGDPELAPLERDFDVLDSAKESRFQFVNGKSSQVTDWRFQLMPKTAGSFTLPAVRVGAEFTNPVSLTVVEAEPADGAPADIFMELEAQPSLVYVQSQVIFSLRLFIGVATGRATLTQPEISGGEAIIERLGEDNQYQTTRAGRTFIVRERRYAIFPQEPGTLTVGPATFEAMVIPDRGFSRVQRFRSGSLELQVQPAVPPPQTAANAVWLPASRVTLSEVWSDPNAELAVGVPQTRTVTVEAEGVLETQLPELTLGQQGGVRQYADQPVLERDVTPNGLTSRRAVSLAVIAQNPGEVTLPAIELPWWNVSEQRWEVAQLPPRTLRFAPSSEVPPPTPIAAVAPEVAPSAAPSTTFWPIVSGVLAAAWLVTLALCVWLWTRLKQRHDVAPRRTERVQLTQRAHLRALRSACAANDAAAARDHLLQWAALRYATDPPRSLGALAPLLPNSVAAQVLHLEASIYGGSVRPWDGRSLTAVLAELDAVAGSQTGAKNETLLPLYR